MGDILHSALQASPPELQNQLDYIITQLNSGIYVLTYMCIPFLCEYEYNSLCATVMFFCAIIVYMLLTAKSWDFFEY